MVVRGAVGGRAAGFALERLGFPVWSMQTVTLPWHPGHGRATRIVPDDAAFAALVDDLIGSPRLAEIGGILTGYLGNAAQAEALARLVDAVKRVRPDALYLCDPVMGDHGALYVPQATAEAIRDLLAPRADILTPNPTELAFLSGQAAETPEAIIASARSLQRPRIAVTSAAADAATTQTLLIHGESVLGARHARIDGRVPNGTGDLFAALLLARLVEGRGDGEALRLATSGVASALAAAIERGTDELPLAAMQEELVRPRAPVTLSGGRSWVAGVDGCKAGWIAVFLREDGGAEPVVAVTPRFADLLAHPLAPEVIAVDMPIGLPERIGPNGRGPEKAVRPKLGQRQSSVFAVPSRAAVYAEDYRAACDIALATSQPPRRVSKQCFHLFRKIREIDGLISPATQHRVFEAHPELAFWRLNGERAMSLPKHVKSEASRPGLDERRDLLVRHGFDDDWLQAVPRGAGLDDLLDAAALALIARRILAGEAQSFPAEPQRDARGLEMAIWA